MRSINRRLAPSIEGNPMVVEEGHLVERINP